MEGSTISDEDFWIHAIGRHAVNGCEDVLEGRSDRIAKDAIDGTEQDCKNSRVLGDSGDRASGS